MKYILIIKMPSGCFLDNYKHSNILQLETRISDWYNTVKNFSLKQHEIKIEI